ncbi:uncharacterized protein LOC123334520 isoform X3 [Bubalus bubalis]|uniref:uncharacterized protein LOC123334520 isoform X3 n=1 Tax=Bubalus bubalis TaxID=89462 RepID=UPI001E1B8B80|nr:uncharacterized protein LOC123334520 isoform X3 [Bubalus bubalis]
MELCGHRAGARPRFSGRTASRVLGPGSAASLAVFAISGSGAELLPWAGVWRTVELRAGNQAGVTRDRRLLRCNATGVQRFKPPLTLLDRRLENSGNIMEELLLRAASINSLHPG